MSPAARAEARSFNRPRLLAPRVVGVASLARVPPPSSFQPPSCARNLRLPVVGSLAGSALLTGGDNFAVAIVPD